jgi:2-hydroxy-3-keto-5-methylthiopentenyl-1-phosphate phosphatase
MPSRGVLQLDFDGTVVHGDVSTGILSEFAGPEWSDRVESASRVLLADPDSPALIDTMAAGFAALTGATADYLRFARRRHPARPGLQAVVDTAERLGLECHVVSNGFEFYIQDYLRAAGVDRRVELHCGAVDAEGRLVYAAPDGRPARGRFKVAWAEHFLGRHNLLVYAGDGTSDLDAGRLAGVVFARDSLLTGLSEDFAGTLRAFETLHDIARDLEALLASG